MIPGQRFTLGDSDLVVRMVEVFAPVDAEQILERGGSLLFNRSPRVEPRYVGAELPEPRMPKDPVTRLFPWPMLVAPTSCAPRLAASMMPGPPPVMIE